MPKILVLNGSNLNMLGIREPEFYGTETLQEIEARMQGRARELKVQIDFRQSNHEGDIIDWIHEAHTGADGVILNPGGFTRTSLSILDAIKAISKPVIELHMGNPHKREAYRGSSFISHGAYGIIAGFRGYGYLIALDAIVNALAAQPSAAPPARPRRPAPAKRRTLPARRK